MGRIPRYAICNLIVSIALVSAGCLGTSKPIGHEAIRRSDLYISESVLSEIINAHLSRSAVILQLGEPDEVNEAIRSIGWERCVSSKGYSSEWFFVPYRVTSMEVTDCQFAGVWFDEQDRAVAWDATRHNSAYGPMDTSLQQFLSVPGGSRR